MKKLADGKKIEYCALALFIALHVAATIVHEPWFDEAQSWQIAKCASLRELLLVIPHYEGHPPLWWLILAVPAKLGVPYEIGLKTVGFIISITAATLMIFYSNLPRMLRLTLPFTYFFFYQYGVIVRPYGIMLLVMILLGKELARRNERPWRTAALLMLLCLTCAYGFLFAGGIAICMVLEILREKGFRIFKEMFRDQRTRSLCALLLFALILAAQIFPRADTYIPVDDHKNPFWLCLLCAVLTLPVECFCATSSWFMVDEKLLQIASIPASELIAFCLIGSILWLVVICISSKKNLKYLLIPYLLFAVFAAKMYFSCHHIGIVFLFFIFWLELMMTDKQFGEIGRYIGKAIIKTGKDRRMIRVIYRGIVLVCLLVPLYWSTGAFVHDCTRLYSPGRSLSQFVGRNGMEDCSIFATWNASGSAFPESEGDDDYIVTTICHTGVELSAYYPRNMVLNLNDGDDRYAYSVHRRVSYAENEEAKSRWRAKGKPDLILGKPNIEAVYGDELNYEEYTLVDIIPIDAVWKNHYRSSKLPIFLRNDLLEIYALEPIKGAEAASILGFRITDEMIEDFNNGIPAEEILKPYLDQMFKRDG